MISHIYHGAHRKFSGKLLIAKAPRPKIWKGPVEQIEKLLTFLKVNSIRVEPFLELIKLSRYNMLERRFTLNQIIILEWS